METAERSFSTMLTLARRDKVLVVSVFMVRQNASIEVSSTEKNPSSTYLKAKYGGSVIIFSDVDGLLISVVLVLHEG